MPLAKSKKAKLITWLVLGLILIMLRLAAPAVATWYANRVIEQTQGIEGAVADIELAFIVGSYSLNGINIRQTGDAEDSPLLLADKLTISLLWSALFKGEIVAQLAIFRPTIGLYDRPNDKIIEDEIITNEKTWLGLANNIAPFAINKLTIENGTFVMDAQSKLKRSEFRVNNIELLMLNLANVKGANTLATMELTGVIQNQASLFINGSFDPNTEKPTFDLNLEMAKLPVEYIDALMKFYAPFDFEAGQIDMASEIKAVEGQVSGYVQLGVYQLEIFSWHEDVVEDSTNPINFVIEIIGGLLATLFENNKNELVATRIPIEGNLASPDVSGFDAFLGLLRNAFIQAYSLKIEDSVGEDSNTSQEID